MAVPDYQMLMRPLLEALQETSGEVTRKDVAPKIASALGLSKQDLAMLSPSGRASVFNNRLSWAKTYLVGAGAVESTRRGYFRLTERGRILLRDTAGPVSNQTLQQFPEFCDWIGSYGRPKAASLAPVSAPAGGADTGADAATPDEQVENALGVINAELRDELLMRFRAASPAFFEQVVVDLLRAMGFASRDGARAFVTGKSGDGGIDGVVNQDALGLDAIYVQAKRYAEGNGVGRPVVQAFVGSMTGESAQKGVFVTTSHFTADARDYVSRVQQRVILVDGEQLAELALRYNIGTRVKTTLELKMVDDAYFDGDLGAPAD